LRVLVLTSSDQIRDVNEAYRLGANSFLVKPLDFEDFTQLSQLIREFWLKASKAPETHRPPKNATDAGEPASPASEGVGG
jgi:DNA-binding NarL/FixJ family response regulator